MAIRQEVWKKDIQEKLLNDNNEFIKRSINHNENIKDRVVHIPQAGDSTNIEVDRSVFPATATRRTDVDLTYTVKSYSIDPTHVLNFEDVQTSYNKRMSVIGGKIDKINERMGLEVANSWAPSALAGKIVRTTGAGTATQPAGTIGTRKKLEKENIRRMAELMDVDNVPMSGRVLVLQTNMYYELFEDDALLRKDYGYNNSLPTGVIDQLFGFDIYVRPFVVGYDDTDAANDNGTLKAVGAALSANDSFGGIAFQQNMVCKALSSVEMYYNDRDPLFYGDVISAEVFLGSSKMRTDNKGIIGIAQGIV